MKYIIIRVTIGGMDRELPFIFPDAQTHAVVAQVMLQVLKLDYPKATAIRPVSAGFFSSLDCNVKCHGKSETLKMNSRGKEDDAIILMMDYLHGIIS